MRSASRYAAAAACLHGWGSPQSQVAWTPSPARGSSDRPAAAKQPSMASGTSPVSSRAANTASVAIRAMTASHSSRESGFTASRTW